MRWAVAMLVVGVACEAPGEEAAPIPWERGSWPEAIVPLDNPTTPAKVALGRLLFYDPILGSDGETACATCHSEIWGMSDGLPQSIGVGGGTLTGPGREGPNVTTRNSQTLWNVVFRDTLFWDGREASLEAQALAPMHADNELAREPSDAVAAIAKTADYPALFSAAFPDDAAPVSVVNLQRALAAFQRTLLTDHALYESFVDGDLGAFTPAVFRGMEVFAEAGCHDCHVPPTFESPIYAHRGIESDDPGRFAVTDDPADHATFRVPTLRNVRDSEPYFHDGSVQTLEDAVAHELSLSPAGPFSAADEAALFAFVKKALVDTADEPDRPDDVPSGFPVPEDGFRIPR